jgi:hypothetical protein
MSIDMAGPLGISALTPESLRLTHRNGERIAPAQGPVHDAGTGTRWNGGAPCGMVL